MNNDAAHKNKWRIGEVVLGVPFLIGILLHFIFPLHLFTGLISQFIIIPGIGFIITGFVVIIWARRDFIRFNQPTDPGLPTSRLIKSGMFAISRNPLYLAGIIILLGISMVFNISWSIVMLIVSIILCYYILIIPEEKYLLEKFGEEYRDYTQKVNRWFGFRK